MMLKTGTKVKVVGPASGDKAWVRDMNRFLNKTFRVYKVHNYGTFGSSYELYSACSDVGFMPYEFFEEWLEEK